MFNTSFFFKKKKLGNNFRIVALHLYTIPKANLYSVGAHPLKINIIILNITWKNYNNPA